MLKISMLEHVDFVKKKVKKHRWLCNHTSCVNAAYQGQWASDVDYATVTILDEPVERGLTDEEDPDPL